MAAAIEGTEMVSTDNSRRNQARYEDVQVMGVRVYGAEAKAIAKMAEAEAMPLPTAAVLYALALLTSKVWWLERHSGGRQGGRPADRAADMGDARYRGVLSELNALKAKLDELSAPF